MRKAWLLLWYSSLAAGDLTQLKQLADTNRMFELRRSLEQPGGSGGETLFYRALTTSLFGHETEGIELFQKFLSTDPGPEMARKAYDEMASAFGRLARYRSAAEALAEELALTPASDPEREGNENTRALMDSLSDVAPQSLELGDDVPVRAVRNKLGSWNVPVQANGVSGQWIFDTGANVSTLMESEANRMRLPIRQASAWVGGSTGKRNALQLAVAADLQFGAAHIHNVVFLVLADQALTIGPPHHEVRITGILGLPVLRALGRLEISKAGLVRIRRHQSDAGTPNLFFQDESPIVEIGHDGHRVQMFLDTGANESLLYPSFRSALSREEQERLRKKHDKTAGVGGLIERTIDLVPRLRIEFSGTAVNLKRVSLLPEQPAGSGRDRDGVVGMDALWNGFVLDFDAMRFEVQE